MEEKSESEWRKRFRSEFAALPPDYVEARTIAESMTHAFHAELAAVLGPRMALHLRAMPQSTHEERHKLSAWCNHELHRFHLSIRCPRTGRAAALLIDSRGGGDTSSRYRLEVRDDTGEAKRTYSSKELPEFELMEEPPRRVGWVRWRDTGAKRPRSR